MCFANVFLTTVWKSQREMTRMSEVSGCKHLDPKHLHPKTSAIMRARGGFITYEFLSSLISPRTCWSCGRRKKRSLKKMLCCSNMFVTFPFYCKLDNTHCTLNTEYIYVNVRLIFTFMHLADAFIQSDLQLHSGYTFLLVHVFPGNRTHNLSLSWRNVLPLSHTGTNFDWLDNIFYSFLNKHCKILSWCCTFEFKNILRRWKYTKKNVFQ